MTIIPSVKASFFETRYYVRLECCAFVVADDRETLEALATIVFSGAAGLCVEMENSGDQSRGGAGDCGVRDCRGWGGVDGVC